MAKTRLLRKVIRPSDAFYVVEFSPPLRVSSLRGVHGLEVNTSIDSKDTPMRYAMISVEPESTALIGSDDGGSNDEPPWYGEASAQAFEPVSANDFLRMIGRGPVQEGDFVPSVQKGLIVEYGDIRKSKRPESPLSQEQVLVAGVTAAAAVVGFFVGRVSASR